MEKTLRETQAKRVELALRSLAETRRVYNTFDNASAKSSTELLDTAKAKVLPFVSILVDAPPGLTVELNRNVNSALIFAKSAITTINQWGYISKSDIAVAAIGAQVGAWADNPVAEFRATTKRLGTGVKAVLGGVSDIGGAALGGAGDAISSILTKTLKSLWPVLLILALVLVGVYFAKKKGLIP